MLQIKLWRCSGLIVSVLDSGSDSPGSSLARDIVLMFLGKIFSFAVPLSTQEYI